MPPNASGAWSIYVGDDQRRLEEGKGLDFALEVLVLGNRRKDI